MTTVALFALLLLLSAIFSGTETGLYCLNRIRLNFRSQAGQRSARLLQRLLHPAGPTIIAILILNNIITETIATLAEHFFADLVDERWSVLLATLGVTPMVLILGEFLPKQLFRFQADRLMYPLAPLLIGVRWLLAIPVALIGLLTRLVQSLIPGRHTPVWEPYASRLNLRSFFKAQHAEKNLTPFQQGMVDRILALDRISLAYAGVSKPITEIAAIDADIQAAAARETLGPKFYQRYLVRKNGQPIGYISATTLVIAADDALIGELAQPLPHLPVDLPLHEAIQHLHVVGSDLALVTDHTGRPIRIAFRNDALRVLANLED